MVTLFWEDLLAAPLTGRRLRFCCREGRAGAPPPPPHRFPEVKGTEDADSCESGAVPVDRLLPSCCYQYSASALSSALTT
ncbi:hypothetical protein PC129_g23216 [Phytophthora cactorum]|uniref:Uncharacterized protein n=1 Tax=Phytophthora cactorum TaxID=29920 RepID=A0A8T1GXL2_9STRA|nr:hypothetical protein Pcac1_g17863 [Phytophthora cactorum]KAG3202478.1 hypothetical protein PC129_g23216 [Phytophthora cactorum]